MEHKLKEYIHIIPSLDAYPRVRYFYGNLKSLVPRFKRIAGDLPPCFHNKQLNEQLDKVLETFSNGIKVTVFGGDDMDRQKFVISTNGQETNNMMIPPSIYVYICNVKLHGISPSSAEEVWTMLDQVIKQGGNIHPDFLFLYCEVATGIPTDSVENFKSEILKQLQDHSIQLESTHIIVGPPVETIAEQISNAMETKVIHSFCEIDTHLDCYIPKVTYAPHEKNLSETKVNEQILEQFKRTLNVYTLNDLAETGDKVKDKPQTDEERNRNIVSAIPRVVKCLFVSILAEKFNISPTHCNDLICYRNFETRLSDAMSQVSMKTKITNDDLIYMIEQALPELLNEIVVELEKTRSVMVRMRKMKYEVHGYLKQTNISLRCNPLPKPPKLPEELRKEIRSTKGVFGFGTFYGQIEIHVENSHEFSTEENIRALMKKYRFSHPYTIKNVGKRPTLMSFDLEPGNELLAGFIDREPNRGTLGGYIEDRDRKVYGLTCAHVVGQTGVAKVFGTKNNQRQLFSTVQYIFHGGSREDCNFPLVDIAAAEVIDALQSGCKEYLRDNQSGIKVADVQSDIREDLVGNKVFKIGACTGKTYGIIQAVDGELAECLGENAGEYLTAIDIMPGDVSDAEVRDAQAETPGLQKSLEPELCFTEQSVTNNIDGGHKEDCPGKSGMSDSWALADVDVREHNLRIYIYDPYLWTGKSTPGVFSNRGDSGSIVCMTTLSGHNMDFTALSMISAGEFTTRKGQDESTDISLAFKLNVGLEKLHEHCHINW